MNESLKMMNMIAEMELDNKPKKAPKVFAPSEVENS